MKRAKSNHTREYLQDLMLNSAMDELERLFRYSFVNRKLLEEALTHPSFSDGRLSYQRLEYLGDAALQLAISGFFYKTYPHLGPGPLSSIRSANISTEKLARVAVRHMLYTFLRRNSSKLDAQVEQFTIAVMDEPEESQMHGGSTMKAPKVLADIVESIAGAIYVDCNYNLETFWQVFRKILEPIITPETLDEQPVQSLHELCSKKGKNLHFQYSERNNNTIVNVFLDEELIGNSCSEQKAVARLNAARDALQNLSGEMSNVLNRAPMEIRDEKEGKQKLNQICSKNNWTRPVYKLENEEGPGHGKRYISSVQIETPNGVLLSLGEYKSKVKDAQNSAASKMVSEILKEI